MCSSSKSSSISIYSVFMWASKCTMLCGRSLRPLHMPAVPGMPQSAMAACRNQTPGPDRSNSQPSRRNSHLASSSQPFRRGRLLSSVAGAGHSMQAYIISTSLRWYRLHCSRALAKCSNVGCTSVQGGRAADASEERVLGASWRSTPQAPDPRQQPMVRSTVSTPLQPLCKRVARRACIETEARRLAERVACHVLRSHAR